MKNVFLVIGLLLSSAAHADLAKQMSHVVGDWRLAGQAVLRVQQQSDRSIKLYWCDENTYFNSHNKHCTYNFVKVYDYRSELDAFFASLVPNKYCSESLQVSAQYPRELIRRANPYGLNEDCNDTGVAQEATKL